jgi:hypothetical protein
VSIRRAASAGDRTTTLLRAALQDNRLSFLARGLLAVVLSRPLDWRTSAVDLARETPKEGRDAIRAALKELQAFGYLHRQRYQDTETGQWGWDWSISDETSTPTPMGPVGKHTGQADDVLGVVGPTSSDTDPGTLPVTDEPAGGPEDGFPTDGEPDVGRPEVGDPSSYRGSRDRDLDTSMGAHPATSPPGELLAGLMDGLADASPDLAARINRRALVPEMTRLVHLGWTSLMLRRWAEHAGWAGSSPGAVVTRVRDLGLPPERPRSVEPSPQTLCPRHPGEPAGRCAVCEQESLSIPVEVLVEAIAAVRAERKPFGDPVHASVDKDVR